MVTLQDLYKASQEIGSEDIDLEGAAEAAVEEAEKEFYEDAEYQVEETSVTPDGFRAQVSGPPAHVDIDFVLSYETSKKPGDHKLQAEGTYSRDGHSLRPQTRLADHSVCPQTRLAQQIEEIGKVHYKNSNNVGNIAFHQDRDVSEVGTENFIASCIESTFRDELESCVLKSIYEPGEIIRENAHIDNC